MNYATKISYAVKRKLFPIAGYAVLLEYFLELLPRTFYRVRVKVMRGANKSELSRGLYKLQKKNACFTLKLNADRLFSGYYYFEFAQSLNSGNRNTYLDFYDGDSQICSSLLAPNLRGSVREIVHVPGNFTNILLRYENAIGFVELSPIVIYRITFVESTIRMFVRAVFDTWRFTDLSMINKIKHLLLTMRRPISELYKHSIIMRSARTSSASYDDILSLDACWIQKNMKSNELLVESNLISVEFFVVVLNNRGVNFLEQTVRSILLQLNNANVRISFVFESSSSCSISSLLEQGCVSKLLLKEGIQSNVLCWGEVDAFVGDSSADFVAFVVSGDILHPCYLQAIRDHTSSQEKVKFIYPDVDLIVESKERKSPAFKPDWSNYLLFSLDYIGAGALYAKDAFLECGGIEVEVGDVAAKLHGLHLRLGFTLTQEQIVHVPIVLYHACEWDEYERNSFHSLCGNAEQSSHVVQKYVGGLLESDTYGVVANKDIRFQGTSEEEPLVSIIIPTRDNVSLLKNCIDGLLQKTKYDNFEIIVVNNQSVRDDTLEYFSILRKKQRIKVIDYLKPFNYSTINNFAVDEASGEYIVLMNNDVEVIDGAWLRELMRFVIRDDVGAVGARLLYPDGMIQHAGVVIGLGGLAGHAHKYFPADQDGYCARISLTQNVTAVTGACLAVSKANYRRVGGLDDNLAVAFNDVDFCLKLREIGLQNIYNPHATLIHHESLSRGRDNTNKKRAVLDYEVAYMQNKWRQTLKTDPFYNPNLTCVFEDFSLSSQYYECLAKQ